VILASDLIPSEPLAYHLRSCQFESVKIVHVFPVVVAICLLIPESGAFREADGYPDAGMTEFPAISAVSG
jgi:hypothetical protein